VRLRQNGRSGPSGQLRAGLAVASRPRTKIVTENENYLHVEFTSALFRFVDDVEFLIDESNGKIHFHSASPAGCGDLGVNRQRMQAIVGEFQQASCTP
jgi:uncharacterized protein (DUF1499 family)